MMCSCDNLPCYCHQYNGTDLLMSTILPWRWRRYVTPKHCCPPKRQKYVTNLCEYWPNRWVQKQAVLYSGGHSFESRTDTVIMFGLMLLSISGNHVNTTLIWQKLLVSKSFRIFSIMALKQLWVSDITCDVICSLFFIFYFWVLHPVACIVKVIRSAAPPSNFLRYLFIYIGYYYMFGPCWPSSGAIYN
jgi:hypothetical protein